MRSKRRHPKQRKKQLLQSNRFSHQLRVEKRYASIDPLYVSSR